MKHGLLLVDKEGGCTSHDVVQEVRRRIGQKKIGHCGTLDPDATGLLLLTLGRGTRLTRFLIRAPKVYEGAIRFGQATDTYDASGTVTDEAPIAGLTTERVTEAMRSFEGDLHQNPPPYCATKVGGVKFYELARRGEAVPEKTKAVHVWAFEPTGELEGAARMVSTMSSDSGAEDGACIAFRLECSSGTYARSLAHEVGRRLNTASHLARLRRIQIGGFSVEQAVRASEVETAFDPTRESSSFIPFDAIPLPFEEIRTDAQQERRITHGQTVLVKPPASLSPAERQVWDTRIDEGDWVKVVNGRSEFVAVGAVIERLGEDGVRVVQPKIVFK
jgi:tRNA pseudouridine55 synthase